MTLKSCDIYFNSGESKGFTRSVFDKYIVQLTNSDQQYYQTGFITTAEEPSSLSINDSVMVEIDDGSTKSVEFGGYVSRIETESIGAKKQRLQVIGNTYDLWRHHTSANTSFSSQKTSYIASSLAGSFCPKVNTNGIDDDLGVTVGKITFSDKAIGDCLKRLTQLDGYYFYVDPFHELQYYSKSDSDQFTIGNSDIISISPVEEADEDIMNNVLVLGQRFFEASSAHLSGSNTWKINSSDDWFAQKFRTKKKNLSAVKTYVDRSTGSDIPTWLQASVYSCNSSGKPGSLVAGTDVINWGGTNVASPPDWTSWYRPESDFVLSSNRDYYLVFHSDAATSSAWWKNYYEWAATKYSNDFSSDPGMTNNGNYDWDQGSGVDYGYCTYDGTNNEIDFKYWQRATAGSASICYFHDKGFELSDNVGVTDGTFWEADINFSSYSNGTDTSDGLSAKGYAGLVFWARDNNFGEGFGIVVDTDDTGGSITKQIALITNNGSTWSDTDVGSWVSVSTSTTYNIRVEVSGSDLKLYIDGDLKDTLTPSTGLPSNISEFCFSWMDTYKGSDGTSYDTATVEGTFDNLECGITDAAVNDFSSDPSLSGTWDTEGVDFGDVTYDSTNDEIDFKWWQRGYRYGYYADKSHKYFTLSSGMQITGEDGIYWKATVDITTYANGVDTSDAKNPRYDFTIALIATDLIMGFGFQFNCDDTGGSITKQVRPVVTDGGGNAKYQAFGSWHSITTGVHTFKCELDGDDLLFYIDESLVETWTHGFNIGSGYLGTYDALWFSSRDSRKAPDNTAFDCMTLEGTLDDLMTGIYQTDLSVAVSTDGGSSWTIRPWTSRYKIGYNERNVRGEASSNSSVSNYGKHFHKITDNLITTDEDAQVYADEMVSKYSSTSYKGSITIDGRTDIDIKTKFYLDLEDTIGISSFSDINQYTHMIDRNGFRSKIKYGPAPYDIARRVNELESTVYGE